MATTSNSNTTGASRRSPVALRTATPVLVVWSMILFAMTWLVPENQFQRLLSEGLILNPRYVFPTLAVGTLLLGWSVRGDHQRAWNVIVGSNMLTWAYFFLLQ
jgi:hypothetical protein